MKIYTLIIILIMNLNAEEARMYDYEIKQVKNSKDSSSCIRVIGDLENKYKLIWDFSHKEKKEKKVIDQKVAETLAVAFMKNNLSEAIYENYKVDTIHLLEINGVKCFFVKIYITDLLPLAGLRKDMANIVIPISIEGIVMCHLKKVNQKSERTK